MPQCFWSKFDTPLVLLWIQQSYAWDVKNPHLNLQFCQSLSWPRLLLPLDYLHLCPLTWLTGFFTSPLHCQKTYLILQWAGELNWKAMLLFPSAHLMKLFSHFCPLTGTLYDHTKRREERRQHVRKGREQPHFRSYTKLLWNCCFKNTTPLPVKHMCVCGCSKRIAHSFHCSFLYLLWYRILEMLGHLDSWVKGRKPSYSLAFILPLK